MSVLDDDFVDEKYRDDFYRIRNNLPFDTEIPENRAVNISQVTYYLFTRDNANNYIQIDESNKEKLNTTKPIVFLLHGWTENRSRQWYNDLKDALLDNDDVYVVQVDYSEPAGGNYLEAVYLSPQVGE